METSADPEMQQSCNVFLMTSSWLKQGIASPQRVKFHSAIYEIWIKKNEAFAQWHKMKVLNFKVHKSHVDFTSIQTLYWCLEIWAFLWNFHENPIYLLYNFKGFNYSAWFVFSVALKLIWCFPKLCWIVCDLPPLLQMSLFKILILKSQGKKRKSMYV